MTKTFEFKSFEGDALANTCKSWRADVKKGLAFPPDVEQVLTWTESHVTPQENDSQAFGIFEEGKSVAEAIAEVVITQARKGSPWVKLLRLRLKPTLEDGIYLNDIGAQARAQEIFVIAVGGVVELTGVHAAKTLKVFGRSNEQLHFLKTFAVNWQKDPVRAKKTKVAIEGHWLVIRV